MRASKKLEWGLWCIVTLGVISFVAGLFLDAMRTWQIYFVNFLFWSGLAQGAVVFAAVYHVVGARWGPPVRRLAEGMACFLPVSFLLFLLLYFPIELFFSRIQELDPARGAWFDYRFIFVRGGLGLGSLTALSLLFFYYSLRPEVCLALERGITPRRWPYVWLAQGWEGELVEIERSRRGMDFLAVGVLLAYPINYTFMAFDLIMALDPYWYSSLFGGYFFVSTVYLGLAGLIVVTALMRRFHGGITDGQLHDLGKLLFAFNLTYMAMIWSQYLVIWYGNLPEETHFIVLRLREMPWAPLSWGVFTAAFVVPFFILLGRRAKQTPSILLFAGVLISAALWFERYVLVVPSLWQKDTAPLGVLEAAITAGFLGVALLSYIFFARNYPITPLIPERILLGSEGDPASSEV